MCSTLIQMAHSCYIDNFASIAEVFGMGISVGVIIGTVVGLLLLFIRKFNS